MYVVLTRDVPFDCPGATVLRDFGPVNIQRWWNVGIDASGADHVGLFNDDVTMGQGLPRAMSRRLDETGATACYVATDWFPVPKLTGWAFMIDTRRVRPDESFAWYYGDNDLREQALATGGETCIAARVAHHHPGESTQRDATLEALAAQDHSTFKAKWPAR